MFAIMGFDINSKHAHYNQVSTALSVMRKQDKFSDLQFVCKDDSCSTSARIISAHQAIFSKLSNLLKSLFTIARSKQPYDNIAITLDSVSASIVEKLMEYIYEGKTTIDNRERYQLVHLCSLLQLELPIKNFELPNPITYAGNYSQSFITPIVEMDMNNGVNDISTHTTDSIENNFRWSVELFQNENGDGICSNSTPIAPGRIDESDSNNKGSLWNHWKSSYKDLICEMKKEPCIEGAYSISKNCTEIGAQVPLRDTTNTRLPSLVHSLTNPYQCSNCDIEFSNEAQYNQHKLDMHSPPSYNNDKETTALSGILRTASGSATVSAEEAVIHEICNSVIKEAASKSPTQQDVGSKPVLKVRKQRKDKGRQRRIKKHKPYHHSCARTRPFERKTATKAENPQEPTTIKKSNMKVPFHIGDLVWGKVKGYSLWPAKIISPPANLKHPSSKTVRYCVKFFVTNNFAWLKDIQIKQYVGFRESMNRYMLRAAKSKSKLHKAIKEADELILCQSIKNSRDTNNTNTPMEATTNDLINAYISEHKHINVP